MNYNNYFARIQLLSSMGRIPHCTMLVCNDEKMLLEAAKDFCVEVLSHGKSNEDRLSVSHRYDSGSLVDVIHITKDTATAISVASVRNLIKSSYRGSIDFDKKIFVLHSCSALGEVAQNALLKILEEPPQGVHFLLLASSTASLLETVKSRTQILEISVPEASGEPFPLEEDIFESFLSAVSTDEYAVFSLSQRLSKHEKLKNVLELFMDFFSDASLYASMKDDKMLKWLYNKKALDALRLYVRQYTCEQFSSVMDEINLAVASCVSNVSKQLLIEAMLLRIREELNAKGSRGQV